LEHSYATLARVRDLWIAPINPALDGLQRGLRGIHFPDQQNLPGPFKVKKDAKTRVFGGFSPKSRGQTIPTVMPCRFSSSLIFCPNLHTKIIALAPREPLAIIEIATYRDSIKETEVDVWRFLRMDQESCYLIHRPADAGLAGGVTSVQRLPHNNYNIKTNAGAYCA
jgi:hypothetical protein